MYVSLIKDTMAHKKQMQRRNSRLQTPKELRILLHDIALNMDLIPIHYRLIFKKQKDSKSEQLSSCVNESQNFSDSGVYFSKENVVETNSIQNKTSLTSVSKHFKKKNKKKHKIIEFELNDKNEIESNRVVAENHKHNGTYKSRSIEQKFELTTSNDNESSSSKEDNQTSSKVEESVRNVTQKILQSAETDNIESSSILSTYFTNSSEITSSIQTINFKIQHRSKKPTVQRKNKLNLNEVALNSDELDDTHVGSTQMVYDYQNCLDKKNLTLMDNDKMKETDESIIYMSHKNNSSLVASRTKIKQRKNETRQNRNVKSSSATNIDLGNKISINKTPEDIRVDAKSENSYSSYISLTTSNDKVSKKQEHQDIRTNNKTTSSTVDKDVQAEYNVDARKDFLVQSPVKSTVNNFHKDISKSSSTVLKLPCSITLKTDNCTKILPEVCIDNKPVKVKQSLPKIIQDNFLPKGSIQIKNVNKTNINSQNNNIGKHIFQEQNKLNDNNKFNDDNKDTKQTSYINNAPESINTVFKRKENKDLESLNDFTIHKTSECTSELNNNNLKNKNISSNKFHNKVLDDKTSNPLMTELRNNIYPNNDDIEIAVNNKNYTLKPQVQPNRLDGNIQILNKDNIQDDNKYRNFICDNSSNIIQIQNETNMSQNREYKGSMDILNGNASDFTFVAEEKESLQQKRTIEENNDLNKKNKRVKLDRNCWIKNNIISSDSPISYTSVESNIKDVECNRKVEDLRHSLNKKRLEKTYKIMFENNNIENAMSNEINLNTENSTETNIATETNVVENSRVCRRLFFEESPTSGEASCEEKNTVQTNLDHNNDSPCESYNISEEMQHTDQQDINIHEDDNIEKMCTNNYQNTTNNDDDDDCISLFAGNSFDESQYESTVQDEENNICETIHSNMNKYEIMSTSNFENFQKQNRNEFNKQYAELIENNAEILNKPKETETFNEQQVQTSNINSSQPTTAAKLISPTPENTKILLEEKKEYFRCFGGYCFLLLKYSVCHKPRCNFSHNFLLLIENINSKDPSMILDIIKYALSQGYHFFCQQMYLVSLTKLNIDEILIMYKIFCIHGSSNMEIIRNIIRELLNKQMPLKMIVDRLVTFVPVNNFLELHNILVCVEPYIKPGEYWATVRTIILTLQPNENVIENILYDCINNDKLSDIEDINNIVIRKLHPVTISTLNENIITQFKSLLAKKIMMNSNPATSVQEFGENIMETIASPDSEHNVVPQIKSPEINVTSENTSKINRDKIKKHKLVQGVNVMNDKPYKIFPIDNLPDPKSSYRDHENLWKFYVDLERLKKGLKHEDYDYVIEILENYIKKQSGNYLLFMRSCYNIFRKEIKSSEYHLANIIRRTVQMGNFNALSKILFEIGLDILVSLVDKEAWELGNRFIQLIYIHKLPYNAEFVMLSAEIYLANKRAIKALDLLKYKNIICTSRAKWHVESTINDEYVRNKIICILLDSLCNDFIEHAFFLFQFLLEDQSSRYYPIDLSRYVDKLITSLLSKNNTNLITEMGKYILKYNLILNTTTCRALISTSIHIDETLTKNLYNYAEAIGIYSAMKLWPVTYTIISTDLTEEEVYLIFLQMLKKLAINFGHTIEFVKYHRIPVYLIFEVKSTNEQFYCTKKCDYNSQAITYIKILVREVLRKRFDPPISLMNYKGRICRLQAKSLINYLKSKHCS